MKQWLIALCCALTVGAPHAATPPPPDTKQFVQLFFPPTLLSERVRGRWAEGLAHAFADELREAQAGAAQLGPGAYSEQDLKQLLLQIDRLTRQYMGRVSPPPSEMVTLVTQKLPQYNLSSSGLFFQEGSDENKIAQEDTRFMTATAMWSAYHIALTATAPNLLDKPGAETPPWREVRYSLPFHEVRGHDRAEVGVLLRSKRAADLLPGKPDLAELHQQNEAVLSFSKALMGSRQFSPYDFERWMFERVESTALDLWFAQSKPPIEADAQVLRERLLLAADPMKSGACDALDLNTESVIASRGDWTKVKTGANVPLDPKKGGAFGVLVEYHERGCFVKKDLAMARKLLEQWANLHGDMGKIAHHTHCKMALWLRYGVGGQRDAVAAQRWEERALRETGAPCPAPSLIDPRDPWSDLH